MKLKRPNIRIHLHHFDLNDNTYETWEKVIPLFIDDHTRLHEQNLSEEQKRIRKIRFLQIQNKKGYPTWKNCNPEDHLMYGKHFIPWNKNKTLTENHKNKVRESVKKLWKDPEYRNHQTQKRIEQFSGCHWWTNGLKDFYRKECPAGCWKGKSFGKKVQKRRPIMSDGA